MKKIFFLSLLSVALYSCSNDDFDVTSNNTGSYKVLLKLLIKPKRMV